MLNMITFKFDKIVVVVSLKWVHTFLLKLVIELIRAMPTIRSI